MAGLCSVILTEIYASVMQREFQHTDNRVGKAFAIVGIYLFVVGYCRLPFPYFWEITGESDIFHADALINSTTWLYGAEVLPMSIRSKVMGLAGAAHFVVNVSSKPCCHQ